MKLVEKIIYLKLEKERSLQKSFPVKIISIGNITIGGAGKTPFTIKLSEILTALHKKHAIVTRGYRGKYKKKLLVSNGEKLLSSWKEAGDEAILLSIRTGVPVAVSKKRSDGIALILSKFPNTEYILLDDAFSHISVKRDIDILIIDAWRSIENEKLIPFGTLREPIENIKRADLFFINKQGPFFRSNYFFLRNNGLHPLAFKYINEGFFNLNGHLVTKITDRRKFAIAGIAHPSSFFRLLADYKIRTDFKVKLPDHFSYNTYFKKILSLLIKDFDITFFVTEKDGVKLIDLPEDVKNWIIYPKISVSLEKEAEKSILRALNELE